MRTRIISFHGGKGGVGTTTLVAETTAVLSRYGLKVVAVDLDLYRGDLHCRLDLPITRGTHTLADLLPVLDEADSRILGNALSICGCGARLLPSPSSSTDAGMVEDRHIRKLLPALSQEFDYILIDIPCLLNRVTTAAIDYSNLIVLVVTSELACLGGAKRAIAEMETLGKRGHRTALVVNRTLEDVDLLSMTDIESFLDLQATAVLPEDTRACRRAGDAGRLLTSERSTLGQAIADFVQSIIRMSDLVT
jgi:Flp pilus assembly CpaE family ATPase